MPPRFLTLAIVALWLAAAGWFVCWDVWPRLHPGEQPYTIDLAREVTHTPRRWHVFRNGETVGFAESWVTHNADDDTYGLFTRYRFHRFQFTLLKGPFPIGGEVRSLDSTYRVTREGNLRAVEAEGTGSLTNPEGDITIHVKGKVRDGLFTSRWKVASPLLEHEFDTEPVALAANYSMLSPLQPWNRLTDVQENRTWRLRLFDPLADALGTLVPGRGPTEPEELEAGVLQGTDTLPWNNRDETCLKIEYRGKDLHAYTWVRQADGLVLRQEAFRQQGQPQEEHLTLERVP